MRWIIADWDDNKKFVFDDIAEALKVLGHSCVRFSRIDMEQRDALLDAIASEDFDGLLTWQRFYPMQLDLIDAIAESNLQTVYMDYGFIPHYHSVVFDTQGENATSSWRKLWLPDSGSELDDTFREQAERLIEAKTLEARRIGLPQNERLRHLREPFVFIPLQRPHDSVVRYDSKVHDFGHLVRRVLELARGRLFVVCKTHPLDADIDLGVPDKVPGSHIALRERNGSDNEALCDYLLSHAAVTIGVNSNMLFRSLLYGTPTVATGEGWYTGSEAMHEVDGVEGLCSLQYPPLSYDRQKRYVATCLSRQLEFSELRNPDAMQRMLDTIGANSRQASP